MTTKKTSQKYSVNQHLIETLLSWVTSGEIAIPEIQRPFVWDATKVRDLMDSLYKGYPVGYIIAWKNPNVRLKDGSLSSGKKILIDGQQRVTALMAAILASEIINKDYRKIKIQISFHPLEQRFEVFNPAIAKDSLWIHNIAEIITGQVSLLKYLKEYFVKNPNIDEELVEKSVEELKQIPKKQIGYIELAEDLEIQIVTEIFIRINREGVVLSQADFVMSKIASYGTFGSNLRKCIDYFCHLAVQPDFYNQISELDKEFTNTIYFQKMSWLKKENDDLYDPTYNDLLRVVYTTEFSRGRLEDLVSLLSGRNFEARQFELEIVEESFKKLENGMLKFISETNFKRFLMIIKSAGFIDKQLINSQSTLNFAYALYLKLIGENSNPALIESYVRKWFVISILTSRYSGSSESSFDYDIKNIDKQGLADYLKSIEEASLTEDFWNITLVQELNKSTTTSAYINIFFAAQVKANDLGFLSTDITVRDMISHRGDIHHIFPKAYLKTKYTSRSDYNQIANYVYAQSEINIKIGKKDPKVYFQEILEQCQTGNLKYGGIKDEAKLRENLAQNCIPDSIFNMDIDNYFDFLVQRKKLMAKKIKDYYFNL